MEKREKREKQAAGNSEKFAMRNEQLAVSN
jgi:hypothetical protein